MKTKIRPLLIVLLVAATCVIPCQTQAYVLFPSDFDARSGITITETAMDDPNDTDQGFQTSDRDVIVQINNGYRRYLGVVIDQTIQGQAAGSVDNGPNDRFVGLGSKLISADNITTWSICARDWNSPLCTFYTPSNRNYILPVPANAAPGSEVKFRLRIVGPAMLSASPDSDIDKDLILETFGYSLWEVVVRDLVKLCLGGQYPNPTYTVAFLKELMTELKYVPAFWSALEKKDYGGMYDAIVNWLIRSEALKQYAADQGLKGSTDLMEVLNVISGTLKAVTIAEMTNAMTQWGRANWQETYEIVVVVPKISDIQPASGKADDLVIIHGMGFDAYHKDNNSVFFTGLNPQGVPWLKLKAKVESISGSGTMGVRVPADFVSGPVMVCTGKYCSNTDVVFSNPQPTGLSIISPANNAKVSGSISVVAVVPSPPVPFPASVGRLLVDGTVKAEKAVTTPDFSFVLDTGTLTAAVHTLTVELITAGQTLSASVQINVATPSATLSSPSPLLPGSTVSGTVTVSAAIQNPPSPVPSEPSQVIGRWNREPSVRL